MREPTGDTYTCPICHQAGAVHEFRQEDRIVTLSYLCYACDKEWDTFAAFAVSVADRRNK
jgi:DNA-directed RNA polymerase subunit M/transcription elongation factor TFIIS